MKSDRHLMRAAVYLIIQKDDQVLFIRRSNTGYRDGEYTLPAGHVEEGETFLHTCTREAKEEVGIDIDEAHLTLVHVMQRFEGGVHVVDYYFSVSSWHGEPYIGEPHKADELTWINKNAMNDDVIHFVRKAISHVKDGVMFSHDGIINADTP